MQAAGGEFVQIRVGTTRSNPDVLRDIAVNDVKNRKRRRRIRTNPQQLRPSLQTVGSLKSRNRLQGATQPIQLAPIFQPQIPPTMALDGTVRSRLSSDVFLGNGQLIYNSAPTSPVLAKRFPVYETPSPYPNSRPISRIQSFRETATPYASVRMKKRRSSGRAMPTTRCCLGLTLVLLIAAIATIVAVVLILSESVFAVKSKCRPNNVYSSLTTAWNNTLENDWTGLYKTPCVFANEEGLIDGSCTSGVKQHLTRHRRNESKFSPTILVLTKLECSLIFEETGPNGQFRHFIQLEKPENVSEYGKITSHSIMRLLI